MESLLESWKNNKNIFLISDDQVFSYERFYLDLTVSRNLLKSQFTDSQLFVLEALNNYETYLKFISLLLEKHIVFLSPPFQFNDKNYRKMLANETSSTFHYISNVENFLSSTHATSTTNQLLSNQLKSHQAGFIVRTSGTSGKKFKFILHNPLPFVKKYQKIKNHFNKTLAFSPADSIAGIETLLEVLTHSNTLTTSDNKLIPMLVGNLIEKYEIDYLQTTPSFLNLMIIAGVFSSIDLEALKKIAYGSEPVLNTTLLEVKKRLPHIEFKHTYGMSEFGILSTFTSQNDPTTFTFDQNINEGRVIDGILEIKTFTQSLGYLNYQNINSPWFRTGDVALLEETGFMKILGRSDDLINIAGRKFYPSEVEDLLIYIEGVCDVVVSSKKNDLIGNIIIASFFLNTGVNPDDFRRTFKNYCEAFVPHFMIPHEVNILKEPPITTRFKKSRAM